MGTCCRAGLVLEMKSRLVLVFLCLALVVDAELTQVNANEQIANSNQVNLHLRPEEDKSRSQIESKLKPQALLASLIPSPSDAPDETSTTPYVWASTIDIVESVIVAIMWVVFLILVLVPTGRTATFVQSMQCMNVDQWTSKQIGTVRPSTMGAIMRHIELELTDELPSFRGGSLVYLKVIDGKFHLFAVTHKDLAEGSEDTLDSQRILGVVVNSFDSGSIVEGYINKGDVVIGLNCQDLNEGEFTEMASSSADISALDFFVRQNAPVVITTLATHPGYCWVTSIDPNGERSLILESNFGSGVNECDMLLQVKSLNIYRKVEASPASAKSSNASNPQNIPGKASPHKQLESDSSSSFNDARKAYRQHRHSQLATYDTQPTSLLELDSGLGEPKMTIGFFKRYVLGGLGALFGLALLVLAIVSVNNGAKKNVEDIVVTLIRVTFLPMLTLFSMIFIPEFIFSPEVANSDSVTIANILMYSVIVVGLALGVGLGSMWIRGKLHNQADNHVSKRRPLHIYGLIVQMVIFLACAVPAVAFTQGKAYSDNFTLRQVRVSVLVMSWISTAIGGLLLIISALKYISTSHFSLPVPQLLTPEGLDLANSLVAVTTAVAAFIDFSRNNVFAQSAVCDSVMLTNLIHQSDPHAIVNFGSGKDLLMGSGAACEVQCSNGFSTHIDCYDYGMIGGRWVPLQEGTFDTLMNLCTTTQGCSYPSLVSFATQTRSTVSCPIPTTTTNMPIQTQCVVGCGHCRNATTTATCQGFALNGTVTVEWAPIFHNDTLLGCPDDC